MSTTKIRAWDVWLANVQFEDSPETKPRPVVITETGESFILALKVTSHEPRDMWGEYQLIEWQAAGLQRQSTVRISKRLKLPETAMAHRIGTLHPVDVVAIRSIMTKRK